MLHNLGAARNASLWVIIAWGAGVFSGSASLLLGGDSLSWFNAGLAGIAVIGGRLVYARRQDRSSQAAAGEVQRG